MRFFKHSLSAFTTPSRFATAYPFPHVIIDGLCDAGALRDLATRYPKVDDMSWWQYDNPLERKYAFNDLSKLHQDFRDFFDEANSPAFIGQLAELTGLKGLVPDHTLRGGGLHQIAPGGKLDVHEDFNVNRDMRAWRKLNLIVYLNEPWDESYGGHLQLWDAGMTTCVEKVLPLFNRAVLFRTDMKSNHGHPDPLTCPDGMTRRSLATYYYVPMTDEEWEAHEYTSTQFKKRPEDPDDRELDEMRVKRNLGRLTDKTSK